MPVSKLSARIRSALPNLQLLQEEPLFRHTTFRIGGPAEVFALPRSEEELSALLQLSQELNVKPVILGAGSNVLAPDEGLRGLVICTRSCLDGISRRSEREIEVQCGVTMARAANYAKELGLTGLEFAHGIPGTVGGGVYMNAGAYGGEIKQVAASTAAMLMDGTIQVFSGSEQEFSYRHSVFADLDCVILRTVFRLEPGNTDEIKARMQELAEKRRNSQPLEMPSAGSTFKRPVGGYAGALIQAAGLKGYAVGGAMVSEKHAGFVVNNGGATAADVLQLMADIEERVYANSGIRLEPEVRILCAQMEQNE